MEVVVADSFLPASSRCSTTVGRGPGSSLATSPPPPARPRVLHLDLASREIQGRLPPFAMPRAGSCSMRRLPVSAHSRI